MAKQKGTISCYLKKATPIMCPAVFHATIRGKRPTKSELDNVLGLGDHKLKGISIFPVLSDFPVYINQNIAPELGLVNG